MEIALLQYEACRRKLSDTEAEPTIGERHRLANLLAAKVHRLSTVRLKP
jgi:hypothetical protein